MFVLAEMMADLLVVYEGLLPLCSDYIHSCSFCHCFLLIIAIIVSFFAIV